MWRSFIDWIAANPLAGNVPGAEGARKLRWSRAGSGKSGGARVTYFNLTEEQIVLLVTVYAKADRSSMVRQARERSGLTQAVFAERIATPVATLRDWEQGRFAAPGGVLCLMRLIAKHPELSQELAAS